MTPTQFRKIALALPNAVESEHMGHPDFRVGGKIFASLGAPGTGWAMVKLTAEQQLAFCRANAGSFQPCNGAWGLQGCTNVLLPTANLTRVRSALKLANENVAATLPRKRLTIKVINVATKRQTTTTKTARTKTSEFDDPTAVTEFLRELQHPFKSVIERVRLTIMKSDPRITEGLKWNAPSCYCHGWFATFNLRTKSGVCLVLHHGAKARRDSTLRRTIVDPTGLLTWKSADRATVSFSTSSDFKLKQKSLQSIIKQWIQAQVELGNASPTNPGDRDRPTDAGR